MTAMVRSPTRSVFGRVVFVGFAAGLVALLLATIGTAWVVGDDKDASLVEQAIRRADRIRDAVAHRLALARAELRAVTIAADTGRVLDAPALVSGSALAIRCVRGTDELLDASSSAGARETLRSTASSDLDGVVLSGGSKVVVTSHLGAVRAAALYELSDVIAAPRGWTVRLARHPEGPLVAKRRRDRHGLEVVRVVAPAADGLGVTVTAPLAPARSAAFAITRRVLLFSSLAVIPVLLLAWFLSRAVTAPIVALAEAVRGAEGGRLALPPLPSHEIGDLGSAIEAMSARLRDNAKALREAITLGRRLDGLHDADDLLAALARALQEALPRARWTVLPAQRILDGDLGDDCPLPADSLAALLKGASAETPREEDSTQPILVHGPIRSPGTHEDVVVVGVAEAGRAFGLAIGSAGRLDESTVRHAELFARTAAAALHREQLVRAAVTNEKLLAVGRLAAGVAHEMNNPLAFVLANLHGLEARLEGDDQEAAAEARQGAERLARIVRDVSSLSRGGPVEAEDLDLAELAAFTARVASSRRQGVEVILQAPAGVWVRADRGRIEQILLNLLVNAIDATGGGPDVRVHLSVRVEGDAALAEIKDNGPGIPVAVQGQLFGAFFTTKGSKGTGLGLYLSRSFAQASGGDVSLASTGPDGTTFVLRLPALPERVHPPAQAPARAAAPSARPRILIVDDEPAIVRSLQRWLGTRADVVGTTDPREAVELAVGQEFALILCDLHMPIMSGTDVLAELRARAPANAARLVIMTGSTHASSVEAGVRVVGKPIGADVLKELLDAM
jgi:signal transduction histidine kinase/CheY-like chemotaxis protein